MADTTTITLTPSEVEIIKAGLQLRVCLIETSDPTLRAIDLYEMDMETQENLRRRGVRVNALSTSQMEIILTADRLLKKLGG